MYSPRMKRRHSGGNVVFAEEVARVIEDELVVIGIAVEERNPLRAGVLFQRARDKAADHSAIGHEGGVGARGEMRAVAHDRAYVANVELPHGEIAFPSQDIHRVEGIVHGGELIVDLDPDLPFTIPFQDRRRLRSRHNSRVV